MLEEIRQLRRILTELEVKHNACELRELQSQELINNASGGILIIQDGVIKFENGGFLNITGYPRGNWSSSDPIKGLAHPEDLHKVILWHSLRLQDEESQGRYDFRVVCKDGTIKWIEMKTSPSVWEGKPANRALITDVTVWKYSERALKERESHFRPLLETIPDALIVYEASGNVTFINRAFEQLFGWPMDELVGKPLVDFVPSSEEEITRQSWEKTIRGEKVIFETKR